MSEVREQTTINKKTKLGCGYVTTLALPLELWNIIIKELLSHMGLDWIKGICSLLVTCKMFDHIIFGCFLEFVTEWNERVDREHCVPVNIIRRLVIPSGLHQYQAKERLSYTIKYECIYRIRFKFEDRAEKLVEGHVLDWIKVIKEGRASIRVLMFFIPYFITDLLSDLKERREKGESKLKQLKPIEFAKNERKKQKLITKKSKLESYLKALDLF